MAVVIKAITPHSPAQSHGIAVGDKIISINGGEIYDMMDLQFYTTDTKLDIVLSRRGIQLDITVEKEDVYTPLGVEFDTYLIDKHHSCKNKCIFCFIDQLPKGLRKDLYFKDDDERLSFLYGNYITMTNMSRREIDRIKKIHLSPINISVHTTDPDLRVFMMKNPRAAEINDLMDEFAAAGIVMNTQVVLCKGINDGEQLKKTIDRLQSLYPQVASCSIVPLGVTRYREGLAQVETFTPEDCARVIAQVDEWTRDFRKEHGERIIHIADEFFIRAGLPLPPTEYYGGFPQLDNGVGMVRNFIDSFEGELDYIRDKAVKPYAADLATGEAMYPAMCRVMDSVREKTNGLVNITVHKIINDFLGGNVWVTGLLTPTDLIPQLKGNLKTDTLLLCKDMLRSEEDMFLDDKTPRDVERELETTVKFYSNDGYELAVELLQEM